MAYTRVQVTGGYVDADGNPGKGSVVWEPTGQVADTSTGKTITIEPVVGELGPDGSWSVQLIPQDTPNLSTGWSWKFTPRVPGVPAKPQTFAVKLADGAQQKITSLASTQPATTYASYLPLSGGTMTGPLTLAAGPTTSLEAATKEYVDNSFHVPASGDTTGAADTAALQAALDAARAAGFGLVRGQPGGQFYLNATLVVGSGVTLDMTGCHVRLIDGLNVSMVWNHSLPPAASASDGAATAGSDVITTSLSQQAAAGQSVEVDGAAGAGTSGIALTGLISAVDTTAGTVTITNLDGSTLNAGQTVTGAAVRLYNRDTGVTVRGGHWDAGNNSAHKFLIRHCDRYSLTPEGVTDDGTAGGFCFYVGDATQGHGDCPALATTHLNADGWHVVGPHYGLLIDRLIGRTGDDGFAITANDWPGNVDGAADCCGNVVGVRVNYIDIDSANANTIKIIAGVGTLVDDVRLGEVHGTPAHHGVHLGDDTSKTNTTGGTYGHIDTGTVRCKTLNVVALYAPAARYIHARLLWPAEWGGCDQGVYTVASSTVTIEHLHLEGDADTSATTALFRFLNHVATTVTLAYVELDHVRFRSGENNGALVRVASGCTCQQIDMVGCDSAWPSTVHGRVLDAGGVIGDVNFTGGRVDPVNQVIAGNTNAGFRTTFAGGFYIGTARHIVYEAGSPVKTYVFSGVHFQSITDSPPFYIGAGAAPTNVFIGEQVTGAWRNTGVFDLTDAATITVDARTGRVFRVTLGGNRTLALPSNGVDGQRITVAVKQPSSGGPYTLTYAAGYTFGKAGPPTLSTTAGDTDYLGFEHDAAAGQWRCLATRLGF